MLKEIYEIHHKHLFEYKFQGIKNREDSPHMTISVKMDILAMLWFKFWGTIVSFVFKSSKTL